MAEYSHLSELDSEFAPYVTQLNSAPRLPEDDMDWTYDENNSIDGRTGISIVNVEYRLAPEHPHPIGLNDSYSALKWVSNIVDRPLSGQILQVACFVHPNAVPDKYKPSLLSFEQIKDAPLLNAETALWCAGQLDGSPTGPEVSPLLYLSYAGLAPVVNQVCGLDLLRDEAFLYEKLLRNEGVRTKITVCPGVPHGFRYLFPAIKLGVEDYLSGLRWSLNGAPQ
ncbi:Alpha/Beta hydrolase protein [Mycena maculata]|uniref:Alpha/Beta hydrolase protein n=1 Tax=Mycena maculata TaxID=230809 RepID=A0AAD7K8N3_9AGAR|nr:Alpha/Beta hydrolase protein [Mycena maculata]